MDVMGLLTGGLGMDGGERIDTVFRIVFKISRGLEKREANVSVKCKYIWAKIYRDRMIIGGGGEKKE